MTWGDVLFSFDGRINRARFWLALLVLSIGEAVAAGLIVASFALLGVALPGAILAFILIIPLVIASFAVVVKRLHDRDKSGWWLLLFYALPTTLNIVDEAVGGTGWLLGSVALLVSAWMVIECGCLRGTAGPNFYGDDPLAGNSIDAMRQG